MKTDLILNKYESRPRFRLAEYHPVNGKKLKFKISPLIQTFFNNNANFF